MKIAFNLKSLALATMAIAGSVMVHGAESSGLRGGTVAEKEEQSTRELQAITSIRTPDVQNVEGTTNGGFGSVNWPFGPFANHPAFSKMEFDLVGGGDINIDRVAVVPLANRGSVAFFDLNRDDDVSFSLTGVELPSSTKYERFRFTGLTGCFDSPPQAEVPGKIPILQDFAVDYERANFDRNIQHLRVQVSTLAGTNRPIIRVCHADFNIDDVYTASVNVAYVDENLVFGFEEFSDLSVEKDSSKTFNRPANTVAVINGFDLEFQFGDRDIQTVIVEANQDGRLFVNFSDQTKNDPFNWKVDLAYIGAEP